MPFKTAGAQGHFSWCPRKAKDAALVLWFGVVGNEPVKRREPGCWCQSPLFPLNNTNLETLLVTRNAIPALDTGALGHFSSWQNYWCFHCHHRLLPTVFVLVCPSYCLLNSVISIYLLSRDICN